MPRTDEFIEAARSYIGVKWMHQGRNRMGIDCVGLVVNSLADIGLVVPDMKGYRRQPDPAVFLGHIHEHSLPEANPAPGMVGIFRAGPQPCHIGIFAEKYGQLSLIHAYAGQRVVMEEPFIHHWPSLLMEVRKVQGLSY